MEALHSLKRRIADRVLLVDILAALFGMGSWLSVNGVYTQLTTLVDEAPESWKLSSYIVIVCQAANVGLIIYDCIQRFWRGKVSDDFLIILLQSIGCISLFLMAFFYSDTTEIDGSQHSLALLILLFFCSLLSCTSSVLFIPYMNRFRETYLVSYMIGEGLGSFVPSILSLIQGVGETTCVRSNSSDSSSSLESVTLPANFSVTAYLIVMSCLQALSLFAFLLLKILPVCQKERVSYDSSNPLNLRNRQDAVVIEATQDQERRNSQSKYELSTEGSHASEAQQSTISKTMNRKTITIFLLMQIALSLLANGLFPSIQTYSCEPYGSSAYHLSINLGNIANPLACYTLFFLTFTSFPVVSVLFSLGMAVGVYIFIAAAMSPSPPLVGTVSGDVLVVMVWIIFTALISYVKLAIATRFREQGGKGLFWYGTMTQIGACSGAVIAFALLNYTSMFNEYSEC